jgi:two-component system chemotaxis response regulator CheB
VFCILHLPADRESRLAELFAARLALPVRKRSTRKPVEPGTVYFAGAGYHLSVEQDRTFSLSCEPPVHFARPAIDVLMESAADAYGAGLAGILLTGANHRRRRRHGKGSWQRGGLTVVQDPAGRAGGRPCRKRDRPCEPHLILPLAASARCCPCWRKHERQTQANC